MGSTIKSFDVTQVSRRFPLRICLSCASALNCQVVSVSGKTNSSVTLPTSFEVTVGIKKAVSAMLVRGGGETAPFPFCEFSSLLFAVSFWAELKFACVSALVSAIIISSEAAKATAPLAIAPSGTPIAAAGIDRILTIPPPPSMPPKPPLTGDPKGRRN